ncbi:MAG: hypothetical protein BGO63_07970 [Candidatus Accumulibacter sp. 66-26]|nr:DUF485 domain-containing protein [Accumulibacter sp.]OJW49226.1 MAG: hypothetical protein BGO63_07970 [Candidatus Accumulibacter sp. 66-26]
MSTSIYKRIRSNPKFQALVSRRTRLGLILSAIVLVAYYGFMMVVAFNPALLHKPLSEGSVLTVGAPIGAAIIIVSWLLTGLYVWRANADFDKINEEVLKEAGQ